MNHLVGDDWRLTRSSLAASSPGSISHTATSPSLSLSPDQIFDANSNYDTPELKTVEPLLTRFVRIYPERATPAGMGLRLELLGCEIDGV